MAALTHRFAGIAIVILSITLTGTFMLPMKPDTKRVLFRIQLLIVFSMLLFFLSRFVWSRLTSTISWTPKSRPSSFVLALVKVAFVAFLVLGDLSVFIARLLASSEPHVLTKVAYLCLGLQVLLAFNLLICSGVVTILHFTKPKLKSRTNTRFSDIFASVLSLVLCFVGLIVATRPPEVVNVTIPLAKLPLSLNGTKFVQISDIHLGSSSGKTALGRIVAIVNQQHPDVVVITGDLVDSSVEVLYEAVQPLKLLQSKYGVFFVTGNHEYIHDGDVDDWFATLSHLGVTSLHNSHAVITSEQRSGDRIYLAGVDDIQADAMQYTGHGMKLLDALRGRDARYPTVLLVHQPHGAKLALQQDSDIDLVLSGHTHGGQFFPLHIPIYLYNPFFAGLYSHKKTLVYVSSGTVFYGVPLRLASTCEITVLTLVCAKT